MLKINKTQAYKALCNGNSIIMAASKMRPSYGIQLSGNEVNSREDFQKILNAFSYYNCTPETGRGIAFYVQ